MYTRLKVRLRRSTVVVASLLQCRFSWLPSSSLLRCCSVVSPGCHRRRLPHRYLGDRRACRPSRFDTDFGTEIKPKTTNIRHRFRYQNHCKIKEKLWFWKSKLSQIDPWSPKRAQEGPQRFPRGSQGRPRGAPRGPRVVSWNPQGRPSEPQGSSKATQGLPEARPRAENRIQNVLKIDFEADVGSEPHSKPIFD